MKVLFVTPEFPPDFGGGIIRYVRDLAIALQEQGCHVSVLKGSAFVHGAKAYELEGIPISVLETSRFEHWLDRFDHFSMFPELRRHLAAAFALHEQARAGEGSDAVEVTDWGMLFLPWVMESSARVLVQMHGSTGQIAAREPVVGREAEGIFFMLLERSVLGDSSNLSAYSRANANWWQALLGKPVNYTPPPLHCAATEVSPISPDRHWLAVGRIQHWKGPQVACAAWQRLGNDAPPLQWIGRDTSHGASGLATDIWLGKEFPAIWRRTIQPVGQFRPDEVLQRMVAAKVVLVPSLWDTFNLVAVEAMALGKVVVISDGAGAVDLVEHGVNGFVFPNGDASALAKLVRQVESLTADERSSIGRRAATKVREKLNPAHIAAEKINLYRSLPEPGADPVPWLRECLLPTTLSHPLAFLDSLPLKALGAYVAKRGLKKVFRRKHTR